jgi:hypothetical protein
MDISAAALPPVQPTMPSDTAHPLYRAYVSHRNFCAAKLITAQSWEGFVYQHGRNIQDQQAMAHPRFSEFQNWMRDTKAGGRKCPVVGGSFPANFEYWLTGGRW